MDNRFKMLEYDRILQMLADLALSAAAREKILAMTPCLNVNEVRRQLEETTAAKKIMESFGNPPVSAMANVEGSLGMAEKGAMLSVEEISGIGRFLENCGRMKRYLKKGEELYDAVAMIGRSIDPLEEVTGEIDQAIRAGEVDDRASATLRDIRRKKAICAERIKEKLNSILRGNKSWFADTFVATRNGRLTLPVKKECKGRVPGVVVDTSQTGGTLFIEPATVRVLQDEYYGLEIDEENEIRAILYALSALCATHALMININREAMETLDFLFAKAKLSLQMNAMQPEITSERKVKINKARHPLLNAGQAVPLDFEIGGAIRGVIITGPNTGGKTVALKTVGLFSLMAQSGLHVPVEEGSTFCLFNMVFSDIGDGQSITENLSTFSSHMTNIIAILGQCTQESLVLLDELGSGTDPAEGMGIAVAVLEALWEKGCFLVATTHYPEIKEYARQTDGFVNARMAFDRQSLAPLYHLEIGFAGESCALYIAKSLGLPGPILRRAYEAAYQNQGGQCGEGGREGQYGTDFFPGIEPAFSHDPVPVLAGEPIQKPVTAVYRDKFSIGDSVILYPKRELAIVYAKADEKGMVGVQIKKKKFRANHKRLKLHVPATEMYPEDYDFSIIFDSVENRKTRKKMEKGYRPGLTLQYEEIEP